MNEKLRKHKKKCKTPFPGIEPATYRTLARYLTARTLGPMFHRSKKSIIYKWYCTKAYWYKTQFGTRTSTGGTNLDRRTERAQDEAQASSCYAAMDNTCGSGNSVMQEEERVCNECYQDYLAGEVHTSCSKAMTDFYTDGNCGFPNRTPHFITCRVCMASSRISISVVCVWICLLASINAVLALFSRGYLDNLNVQVEVLVVVPVVFVLVVNICLIFLDDSYFRNTSHTWTGYNLELFCLQLIVVWSTIWTMILTIVLLNKLLDRFKIDIGGYPPSA